MSDIINFLDSNAVLIAKTLISIALMVLAGWALMTVYVLYDISKTRKQMDKERDVHDHFLYAIHRRNKSLNDDLINKVLGRR